ncbi:MAG: phosphotransferase [Bacillaceae bacterium]|nr:phosphotransferase [Bacillaceae bacterium]
MSGSTEVWQNNIQKFHNIAKEAVRLYPDADHMSVDLLNYSENATYLVRNSKTGAKAALRVCRPGYHKKSQIEGELKWLKAIEEQSDIDVSLPIAGQDGAYVQSVQLEGDPRDYHCTMFTFLEGEAPDEDDEQTLVEQFEKLGEVTAQLHNHSQNWKGVTDVDRDPWQYETILGDNPKWGKWQDGVGITPERQALFQKVSDTIKARLERFGKGPEQFGLIHADLRLANLIVEGPKIKVIDFDDCGFGWYLFDIGSALSFIEHKPYVPDLVDSWVKGYRKHRHLSDEEVHEIPTFIMMRRLMLISWIGSRDNETTAALGSAYTEQTDRLAEDYLAQYQI